MSDPGLTRQFSEVTRTWTSGRRTSDRDRTSRSGRCNSATRRSCIGTLTSIRSISLPSLASTRRLRFIRSFGIRPHANSSSWRVSRSSSSTGARRACSGRWSSRARSASDIGRAPRSSVAVVTNSEIADRLLELSALLELAEANPYAVSAYRRAAEVVRATPAPVAELVREGRVRELRGIGPSIAARLEELVRTGEIAELRELSADVRPELVALGRLVGVGTKRMLEIGRALDVGTAEEFRAAAAAGELSRVPGIGPSTEAKILAGLAREPRLDRGLTINRARALVGAIA